MPSSPASACSSATICWPPEAPLRRHVNLVEQLGGKVAGAAFAVELSFLNGRAKLPGVDVFSLLKYDK